MTAQRTISDEELTAYLDGEGSRDLVAEIERRHADVAGRLAELDAARVTLVNDFDRLLDLSGPGPVFGLADGEQAAKDARSHRRRAWPLAAALVAGLAVMFVLDRLPLRSATPEWQRYVAAYQALYVTETLAHKAGPEDAKAQLARVSEAFGKDMTALPVLEGLDFRRAQILGFRGASLVQIAFLNDNADPVALCILASRTAPSQPKASVMEGMATVAWSDGTYGFLLIGGTDTATLLRAATTVRTAL